MPTIMFETTDGDLTQLAELMRGDGFGVDIAIAATDQQDAVAKGEAVKRFIMAALNAAGLVWRGSGTVH